MPAENLERWKDKATGSISRVRCCLNRGAANG